MTVKELIERLQSYPEDMRVVIREWHMEQGDILRDIRTTLSNSEEVTKTFTDAFDYTSYNSTVLKESSDENNTRVLVII